MISYSPNGATAWGHAALNSSHENKVFFLDRYVCLRLLSNRPLRRPSVVDETSMWVDKSFTEECCLLYGARPNNGKKDSIPKGARPLEDFLLAVMRHIVDSLENSKWSTLQHSFMGGIEKFTRPQKIPFRKKTSRLMLEIASPAVLRFWYSQSGHCGCEQLSISNSVTMKTFDF